MDASTAPRSAGRHWPPGLRPTRSGRGGQMTAKLSSSPCQPTALGRIRILAVATAIALAVGGLGASVSRADVGSVYFDAKFNVGAGETFFNFTFTGENNVGLNRRVMPFLTTGDNNVSTGSQALLANTTGDDNVATGIGALDSNTTGSDNIALGQNAGRKLTTGSNNVAIANAGAAEESGTIRIGSKCCQTRTF